MEDDDPTPRALPRWVELEYKVGLKFSGSLSGSAAATLAKLTYSWDCALARKS